MAGRWRQTMDRRKVRVLMTKCGLDGHDRGVKVVARALRDAGMEVIYTGLHQTLEQVVNAAIQAEWRMRNENEAGAGVAASTWAGGQNLNSRILWAVF